MSAEESGVWGLRFSDAEENTISPRLVEFNTTQTSSASKAYPADRDALALPPMPSVGAVVKERGKVILEFLSDAGDTIESEECGGTIPVVLMPNGGGAPIHTKLSVGDTGLRKFSGFSATDDVVVNASTYTRLGTYTVPDGYTLALDAGQPVHAFFGDDT